MAICAKCKRKLPKPSKDQMGRPRDTFCSKECKNAAASAKYRKSQKKILEESKNPKLVWTEGMNDALKTAQDLESETAALKKVLARRPDREGAWNIIAQEAAAHVAAIDRLGRQLAASLESEHEQAQDPDGQ